MSVAVCDCDGADVCCGYCVEIENVCQKSVGSVDRLGKTATHISNWSTVSLHLHMHCWNFPKSINTDYRLGKISAMHMKRHCRSVASVCCSVLQCVAVWCSVLQCVAVRCKLWKISAMTMKRHCRSVTNVCCSVLRCVAVLMCVALLMCDIITH